MESSEEMFEITIIEIMLFSSDMNNYKAPSMWICIFHKKDKTKTKNEAIIIQIKT